MLAVAIIATNLARADPERLRRPSLLAAEATIALALAVADGWVFKPGHVFTTSQNLATEWPLIVSVSAGVAAGPVVAGAIGFLFGPARLPVRGVERLLPVRTATPRRVARNGPVLRSVRRAHRLAGHAAAPLRGRDQPSPRP